VDEADVTIEKMPGQTSVLQVSGIRKAFQTASSSIEEYPVRKKKLR
jgi:hypothetical protein